MVRDTMSRGYDRGRGDHVRVVPMGVHGAVQGLLVAVHADARVAAVPPFVVAASARVSVVPCIPVVPTLIVMGAVSRLLSRSCSSSGGVCLVICDVVDFIIPLLLMVVSIIMVSTTAIGGVATVRIVVLLILVRMVVCWRLTVRCTISGRGRAAAPVVEQLRKVSHLIDSVPRVAPLTTPVVLLHDREQHMNRPFIGGVTH